MSRRKTRKAPASAPASPWTFLTNHAHVLVCVQRNPTVLVKEIAAQVGITERAVLVLLSDLEQAGIVTRHRRGRSNAYEVNPDHPLRHPLERHRRVSDLLQLVSQHGTRPVFTGLATRSAQK